MNPLHSALLIFYSLLLWAPLAINHISHRGQEESSDFFPFYKDKFIGRTEGQPTFPESDFSLMTRIYETGRWNLQVEGFSPAYYDKVRDAVAINTVAQPTDRWGAASSSFELPSGKYTIRFTSLLESDGECTYIMRIGGNKIMEFQNPRIHGKDIEEYAPHVEVVESVDIEKGSSMQVEFLPHSNGLVPEGNGYGFARARWKSDIEFTSQEEK